jgi:hypothetical protein|tara:strand:- start:10403 stop:11404 length:1002 start_codon:yes stop_codon:yes gene_type:complete
MEETMVNKDSVGHLFKMYYEDGWQNTKGGVYSALYRAYHPSTYEESFQRHEEMLDEVFDYMEDSIDTAKGYKFLPRNKADGIFSLNGGRVYIPEIEPFNGTVIQWPEAFLLYTKLYEITREFMCYCGTNGIDPDCKGNCIGDYGTLKADYENLYDYVIKVMEILKTYNVDVSWMFNWGELEKITFPTKVTNESVLATLMNKYPEWWSTIGDGILIESKPKKDCTVVVGVKDYLNEWYTNKPTIIEDRDKISINEHIYTSKPLISWSMSADENGKNTWTVESKELTYQNTNDTTHWIFGPSEDGDVVVFRNEGNYPGSSETVFTQEPIVTTNEL